MMSSSNSFVESLKQIHVLHFRQRFEIGEMFGFETRNRYAVEDENGAQVGYAAEQNRSILGHLSRYFLGHWRSFQIHIFGADRKPAVIVHHPFRILFQRLEVSLVDGTRVGALQQRFAILSKKFDVESPEGQVLLEMRSPFWKFWTFPFYKTTGAEVGRIEKKWTGILSEAFTDKDNFRIKFTENLSDEERVLMLASGIFVDLQYFEKKAR